MIDHVGFEVADLARSARFYDARPVRARRAADVRRPGRDRLRRARARLWIVARGRRAGAGFGHVAITRAGRAGGRRGLRGGDRRTAGSDDGPPGPRPQYGPAYYAAYLRDPDGLRVEVVSGAS